MRVLNHIPLTMTQTHPKIKADEETFHKIHTNKAACLWSQVPDIPQKLTG